MIHAKRSYLEAAEQFYLDIERKHTTQLRQTSFEPEALQGQVACAKLIEDAAKMAIWPLDKYTLQRFAGAFLFPFLPFLAERISPFLKPIVEHLHVGE
jgi:hypothetical protein